MLTSLNDSEKELISRCVCPSSSEMDPDDLECLCRPECFPRPAAFAVRRACGWYRNESLVAKQEVDYARAPQNAGRSRLPSLSDGLLALGTKFGFLAAPLLALAKLRPGMARCYVHLWCDADRRWQPEFEPVPSRVVEDPGAHQTTCDLRRRRLVCSLLNQSPHCDRSIAQPGFSRTYFHGVSRRSGRGDGRRLSRHSQEREILGGRLLYRSV